MFIPYNVVMSIMWQMEVKALCHILALLLLSEPWGWEGETKMPKPKQVRAVIPITYHQRLWKLGLVVSASASVNLPWVQMYDGVSKNAGLLQGRTVNIEERWGMGRREEAAHSEWSSTAEPRKDCFPNWSTHLILGNLSPFLLPHKQRYITLKSLEGVPFTVSMWIVV